MKTVLIALALLAVGVGLADTAAATCYNHEHVILDPTPRDTGTDLDDVRVSYYHLHCGPPP